MGGRAMRRVWYVILAIILNSLGHSMTIVTNMGSMPWPASIVNIMHTLQWTMTETIFTEGTVVIILNILVTRVLDWWDVSKEFAFLIPYSILMEYFAGWWRTFGIDQFNMEVRLFFDICGLLSAFGGFALYQKAHCCHPHDVLTVNLKRHFNVRFTRIFNMFLPVLIILACVCHNHAIYAVHVGTVIGLLIQPRVVQFCDEHLVCYCRM